MWQTTHLRNSSAPGPSGKWASGEVLRRSPLTPISSPRSRSQTRATSSDPADSNRLPSGVKASDQIGPSWP